MPNVLPDYALLHSMLRYEPDTGLFYWKSTGRHPRQEARYTGKIAGSITDRGYRVIRISGKLYRASRIAYKMMTNQEPKFEIDHRNRLRDDNRWINLRPATRGQQLLNRVFDRELPKYVSLNHVRTDGVKVYSVVVNKGNERHYKGGFTHLDEAVLYSEGVVLSIHGSW